MNALAKPLPTPTPLTRPYWDACRDGELRMQQCADCGKFRFYPAVGCPHCGGLGYAWKAMSGRGTVYSWIVIRHPVDASWKQDVPFVVAVVELAEQQGLVMPGTLTGVAPEKVEAGMPVEVWFDPVSETITLPRWRPAA